jgi:hypothetical protein
MGTDEPDARFQTKVYLTDAPIDNAEVDAAFITVAEVRVNGKSLEGFEKTTIDVSSLQNGKTELFGDLELESGTTSEIVLVLDNETDVSGEAPGNYILTTAGEKKALASTSGEISINDQVEIEESNDNEIILDFDLRKIIAAEENGDYRFVGDAEISNSIRAVNKLNAGTITGTVNDFDDSQSEAMLVFAYEKGAYAESETQANSEGVLFSNAVVSSTVSDNNGNFELHFVEEGDYELHFVSFADNDADEQLELKGEVGASSATAIQLSGFSVEAGSNVSLEVVLLGLLNL